MLAAFFGVEILPNSDFSVRLNFICPTQRLWPELGSGSVKEIEPHRLSELSGGILNSWVVRTYYELAKRGLNVSISPTSDENAVNVASVRDFGRRSRDTRSFLLIPRGDAHHPMLGNFIVFQNGITDTSVRSSSIPHWPQPGIIKRSASRPPRIEKLVFKGRTRNLDSDFSSEEFSMRLGEVGASLEVDAVSGLTGAHSWNDYSSADAVLAVRNLTRYDAAKKPASKLVNAWIAGVVPILGPEPAYIELRRSKYDFVEVRSPDEVISAISALNNDPSEFNGFLDNARIRALQFQEDLIVDSWIDMINGPVFSEFKKWKSSGALRRTLFFAAAMLGEPISKRMDRLRARFGRRILDN